MRGGVMRGGVIQGVFMRGRTVPPAMVVQPKGRAMRASTAMIQRVGGVSVTPIDAARLGRNLGLGVALPVGLKQGIEALSGLSLDHVKVYYNSAQPAQLNALAYAHGSDIHIAPGQEKHLPHEAWHVVQQMQGRARPSTALGTTVLDDPALEREADVMGQRAVMLKSREGGATASARALGRPGSAPCRPRIASYSGRPSPATLPAR